MQPSKSLLIYDTQKFSQYSGRYNAQLTHACCDDWVTGTFTIEYMVEFIKAHSKVNRNYYTHWPSLRYICYNIGRSLPRVSRSITVVSELTIDLCLHNSSQKWPTRTHRVFYSAAPAYFDGSFFQSSFSQTGWSRSCLISEVPLKALVSGRCPSGAFFTS